MRRRSLKIGRGATGAMPHSKRVMMQTNYLTTWQKPPALKPLPDWVLEQAAAEAWRTVQAEIEQTQQPPIVITPNLRTPHDEQRKFVESPVKRKVVRAGRRGGKTVGVAILAVKAFAAGHRVLYATPTGDQIGRFWFEVKRALNRQIDDGSLYKNETEHIIEVAGTENRIRAKTAWNADTLRGDYCDLLILDEYQLMNEDAWEVVGAPMLLDNNGDAVFIYTPPSIRSASVSKARDKQHAAKLFKKAAADTSGRWETFHFSSHANPHISAEALSEITKDMTRLAYEQEIEAQDKDSVPGALWNTELIESLRVTAMPELTRTATAIDPSGEDTQSADEAGIVTAGIGLCNCKGFPEIHAFVLADDSRRDTPQGWAKAGVMAYHRHFCDVLIAEKNYGGQMVAVTIGTIKNAPPVKLITAKHGKIVRAEPIAALYEHGKVHHVGYFSEMEGEMVSYLPGHPSPNRLDALVHALTELMIGAVDIDDWTEQTRQMIRGAGVTPQVVTPNLPAGVTQAVNPLGDNPIRLG